MNFKSQICTSRSQSEKLLALGLKKETADCALLPLTDKVTSVIVKPSTKDIKNTIPAWSLHKLLMMYGDNYSFFSLENAYGELIHAITIDIEKGTFNKDYLEKRNNDRK